MLTDLDIQKLSTVFDKRSSTYKFYWFLSLLDIVSEGRGYGTISFDDIVIRMLAKAWQPLKYGNFSFGKCDILINHIDRLISISPLNIESFELRVQYYLMNNKNCKELQRIIKELTRYVPYRFLHPWTGSFKENNKAIENASLKLENRALYSIVGRSIVINEIWMDYLISNSVILRDFAYFRLCLFLEDKNDNFVMPVESSLRKTADGMSTYSGFMQTEPYGYGFAAENSLFVKRLSVKQLFCQGDMKNVHSQVNIKTNIENPKKV